MEHVIFMEHGRLRTQLGIPTCNSPMKFAGPLKTVRSEELSNPLTGGLPNLCPNMPPTGENWGKFTLGNLHFKRMSQFVANTVFSGILSNACLEWQRSGAKMSQVE